MGSVLRTLTLPSFPLSQNSPFISIIITSSQAIMGDTYDYIVVGGGTCGPVLAGRLSENPKLSVLVLESGQDSAEMDNMHMAGA